MTLTRDCLRCANAAQTYWTKVQYKVFSSSLLEYAEFPSGKGLTPRKMVAGVKKLAKNWQYDVISIGYPGMSSETARSLNRATSPPGLGPRSGIPGGQFSHAERHLRRLEKVASLEAGKN